MSTPLAHEPDRVLAQVLVDAGLGGDPSTWEDTAANGDGDPWPVRDGSEGDRPDATITVTEGEPVTDRTMPDGANVTHYGLQVRVRGQTKPEARLKAEAIARHLNETLYDLKLTIDGREYSVPSAHARAVRRLGQVQAGVSSLWVYTVDCLVVILAYPTGR